MPELIIHTGGGSRAIRANIDASPERPARLIDLLRRSGVMLDAPCGGCVRCGRCAVWVRGSISDVSPAELELLGRYEKAEPPAAGAVLRLACAVYAADSCEIYIPSHTSAYIMLGGAGEDFHSDGAVYHGDKGSFPRISTGYPQCGVDITVNREGIYSVEDKSCAFEAAFDLGTTAVSLNIRFGDRTVYETVVPNAQKSFGADVITRISYSTEHGGPEALQKAVSAQLLDMLAQAEHALGCPLAGPDRVIPVAGNTVMLYLLSGISPAELGRSPYVPSEYFGRTFTVTDSARSFTAYLPRCTGGFTGGDLTCCLAALYSRLSGGADGILSAHENIMLCDLGTNGEIALFSPKNDSTAIYVTSAAAGPALEGGCISCGSGAVDGAINRVYAQNEEHGLTVGYDVIGGGRARSIAGCALLELTSMLLDRGIVDCTGRMEREIFTVCGGISVTQSDIRQLQLAKGAVCAGAERLLEHAGIPSPDAIIVTGGLGYRANEYTVRRLGLLPTAGVPQGNIYFIPALAMEGALLCCGENGRALTGRIAERCRCAELSGDDRFDELFIESMEFPEK